MFGRKNTEFQKIEKNLCEVLDCLDTGMVVTRGKNCDVLFTSSAAARRLADAGMSGKGSCRDTYAVLYPHLCDNCPNYDEAAEEKAEYDVTDEAGEIYAVTAKKFEWVDDKPATAIYMQNVTEMRKSQQQLFNLAYNDGLTGVPNRMKLKKDFEEKEPAIEKGSLCGAVALFDLDHFKTVNDTYGHNIGDTMLCHLTEYLASIPAYKGHVYRLGGDEFILFFFESAERFKDIDAMREHYTELLRDSFVTYAMPNIDATCTLSMGVALFPAHGANISELLRKADIALYRAKSGGRNRMEFFQDSYDEGKDVKERYINIQPILTADGRTFAYDLMDRGSEGAGEPDYVTLTGGGHISDALNLQDLQNEAKYVITYTSGVNTEKSLKNLPKTKFIIQVPVSAGENVAQVATFRALATKGYAISLAGITPETKSSPLLEIASYCKFEPGAFDAAAEREFIAKNPNKMFIATGIDEADQFESAHRRGFKLFEGYYFGERTVVKKAASIDPMRVNYLRLLKLACTDGFTNFKEISQVISSDVALSYKLLRLLNSAAVGLRNPISSIDMAVTYLGEVSLKNWVALLAMSGVAADKPAELVRISLIRARFGELLAPHFHPQLDAHQVFLTGMFSLLDVALDKSKEELFTEIPVADEIKQSILTTSGPYSDLLVLYHAYEYADWDAVSTWSATHNFSSRVIGESYLAANKWYKDLADIQENTPPPARK